MGMPGRGPPHQGVDPSEIRLGAEDYADEILGTLEVNLTKFIAAVGRGRDRLAGRHEEDEDRASSAA